MERKPLGAKKTPRRPSRANYLTTSVEIKQSCRRDTLYLTRVRYFLYYRVRGNFLEVVAFWHASREAGPSL